MNTEHPKGCATCPRAVLRFNGGRGATTCDDLEGLIVAYGRQKPATRPDCCPLPQENQNDTTHE